MSQQSFDLTPGQNIVNYNLHFAPLSAVVDNMTPYWVRLPDAGRYIPPYSTGGSVPLINAMGGTVLWEAPAIAGIAQIPFITDAGILHITFVDEVLSYTPPSPIPDIAFNNSDAFTFNVGQTLNQTIGFLGIGVRIDNPSGTAYTIQGTGLIIPPWTLGWTIDILPPFNTIVVTPTTNPFGGNVASGGPITVTIYSGKIGISPGIFETPPTIRYIQSASQVTIPLINTPFNITRIFAIDNIVAGVRLNVVDLTITSSISQAFSIYRIVPGSEVGPDYTDTTIVPVAFDPASPVFPATLYVEKNFTQPVIPDPFKSVSQNINTGNVSGGSIVLPTGISNNDIVYLAIAAVYDFGGTINTPTGWTAVKTGGGASTGVITIFKKNTVTSGDSGSTVNFTFSGASSSGYIAGSIVFDGSILTHVDTNSISTGTATTYTFGSLTGGTTNQATIEFVYLTGQSTFNDTHTQKLKLDGGASCRLVVSYDWSNAGNAATYTPTSDTGTTQNFVDIAVNLHADPLTPHPAMSFTLGALVGTIPAASLNTKVNLQTLLGDKLILTSTAPIGIVEPAPSTVTIAATYELD